MADVEQSHSVSYDIKAGETLSKTYTTSWTSNELDDYTFTVTGDEWIEVTKGESSYKRTYKFSGVAPYSAGAYTKIIKEGWTGPTGQTVLHTTTVTVNVEADHVTVSGPADHYRTESAEFTATSNGTVTWSIENGDGITGSNLSPSGNTCTVRITSTTGPGPWDYKIIATYNAVSAPIEVSVIEPEVTNLKIVGPDDVTLGTSLEVYYLEATFPNGGGVEDVYWEMETSGAKHLWIPYPDHYYGQMEFEEAGTVTMKVSGGGATASKTITVHDVPPTNLILGGLSEKDGYDGAISIPKGDKKDYTATIVPDVSGYHIEVISESEYSKTYPGDPASGNPYPMSTLGLSAGSGRLILGVGDVRKTIWVEVTETIIPVTSFIANPSSVEVKVGRTARIIYSYLPENANQGTGIVGQGSNQYYEFRANADGTIDITGKKAMDEPREVVFENDFGIQLKFTLKVVEAGSTFTVTYEGNGGVLTKQEDLVTPGDSCMLPDAIKGEGQADPQFMGWYTSTGTDGLYVGSAHNMYTPTESVTLYARWTTGVPDYREDAVLYIANDLGKVSAFHLGSVRNIEDSLLPALTAIPTLIYGAENRFVTDTGVQRNINLTMERINPPDYDDDSRDDRKWSNGKWWNEFRDAIDFWQNLASDPFNFARTGGFILSFTPSDAELHPEIRENVFISGTITPSFTVQKMTYTLPVVVARMTAKSSLVETVKVRLYPNVPTVTEFMEVSFPKGGSFILPACPTTWIDSSGFSFAGWAESPNGKALPLGKKILMDSDKVFYATWTAFKALVVSVPSGDPSIYGLGVERGSETPSGKIRNFRVTSADITRVQIIVVGGGGSGGEGEADWIGGDIGQDWYAGGAGGSGDVKSHTFSAGYGSVITTIPGRGGRVRAIEENAYHDGEDGHESKVIFQQSIELIAGGGSGGKAAKPGLTSLPDRFMGGSKYNAGGSADTDTGDGEDGTTSAPNRLENVGKGAKKSGTRRGGAGGGAAALNHRFVVGTPDAYQTYEYVSKGGNGVNDGDAGSGKYGGGGGSSPNGDSGRGGDGVIILAFY